MPIPVDLLGGTGMHLWEVFRALQPNTFMKRSTIENLCVRHGA